MATLATSEKNIILSGSWWSRHRTGIYWVKLPSAPTPRCSWRCTAGPQHDTVSPAAWWLALSGNFCILLRACGKYCCSPRSPVDLRKLSKRAFSPPWPRQFVFLSRSRAMLLTVAKLLPLWVLEEKAQNQSHFPSGQLSATQFLPVFNFGHPLKSISTLSNLPPSAHRFFGMEGGDSGGDG